MRHCKVKMNNARTPYAPQLSYHVTTMVVPKSAPVSLGARGLPVKMNVMPEGAAVTMYSIRIHPTGSVCGRRKNRCVIVHQPTVVKRSRIPTSVPVAHALATRPMADVVCMTIGDISVRVRVSSGHARISHWSNAASLFVPMTRTAGAVSPTTNAIARPLARDVSIGLNGSTETILQPRYPTFLFRLHVCLLFPLPTSIYCKQITHTYRTHTIIGRLGDSCESKSRESRPDLRQHQCYRSPDSRITC